MRRNHNMKNRLQSAFTLVELLIAVGIVALIISICIPAIGQARVNSTVTANEQTAKTLNDAINRAILDGYTDAVLSGNDVDAACDWLVTNGYIRELE